MEIQYVYVKNRSQFGKQCIFDDAGPTVDENIVPNSELMADYISKDPCHVGIQKSKQFALHEMQTSSAVSKESGMLHVEGGWPKEVNTRDEEATARFRRRVEKDDNWAPKMKGLMEPMESCVLQNNAVNIYENFFDDMIPTELVLPLSARTVNVYADPQVLPRPITHLSWSPDHGKRLAVSYCDMEFREVAIDVNPYSYIWDIENPNMAFMALKAFCPSVVMEFNPRDPSMLISGLMSGQVCNWDIRTGNTPVQVSHLRFSHRNPVNLVLWINSKTNSEFFSASTGGKINWWDIRKLREPTDSLVMDLANPMRGDVVKAIGVSSLQFEPTMGTKFMAGMENGVVVSGTRKGKNPLEKLALRFNCHYGPVVAIDRNPFSTKNFLTVGDWTARVWAEDTKESNLISTRFNANPLTGGCWSTSRYSVFYVINMLGQLEVYDLLVRMDSPVRTIRLCEDALKAIAPREEGKLLAVGSSRGAVYLVECSEALTTNGRNDKVLMTTYLDRCSRYEKAIDSRLKEVRLAQRTVYEPPVSEVGSMKTKSKEKGAKERAKSTRRDTKEKQEKERKEKEKGDKKDKGDEKGERRKGKKQRVSGAVLPGDTELAEAELAFFGTVQKEIERYASVADPEGDVSSQPSSPDATGRRKKHDDQKTERDEGKKPPRRASKSEKVSPLANEVGKVVVVKRKREATSERSQKRRHRVSDVSATRSEEEIAKAAPDDDPPRAADVRQPGKSKRGVRETPGSSRPPRSPRVEKPCGDECEPDVCCEEEASKARRALRRRSREGPKMAVADPQEDAHQEKVTSDYLAGLSKGPTGGPTMQSFDAPPRYSARDKRAFLREKDAAPRVLTRAAEVARAERRRGDGAIGRTRSSPTAAGVGDEGDAEVDAETRRTEVESCEENASAEVEMRARAESGGRTRVAGGSPERCEPAGTGVSVRRMLAEMGSRHAPPAPAKSRPIRYDFAATEEMYPRISAASPGDKRPQAAGAVVLASSPVGGGGGGGRGVETEKRGE